MTRFRRYLLTLLVPTCLMVSASPGFAQTLVFGVALESGPRLEPSLRLNDLELGDSRVDLRLAGGVSGPLELGVRARETASFGPLGNLSFRSAADFSAKGFATSFSADGVIASVAAEAAFSLRNVPPGAFDRGEAYRVDAVPLLGAAAPTARVQVDLGASYRLSRRVILSARPGLSYTDGVGPGTSLETEARLVRFVDPDDLYLKLRGKLEASADYGAFGLSYDVNRRTWPNLEAGLWLGTGARSVAPGVTLELSQSLRRLNASYSLGLAAEPYRRDVLPYRAALGYRQTLGPLEVALSLYGSVTDPGGVPPVAAELELSWTY